MMYNRLIVEFMQVSLLAASYFILNFEDMVNTNGVYLYEFKTNVKGEDIIISATYKPKSDICSNSSFTFEVEGGDADLRIVFNGCRKVASECAKDIIEEYLSRI
ncbi:MAG: hypothetical protein E7083_07370 [Bacteroidales bacterium]|nr:hypothetical protein [Bacteroidales bacterium]